MGKDLEVRDNIAYSGNRKLSFYKTVVTKTVCYWQKDRHINQWNRIGLFGNNPYINCQLIFDKCTDISLGGKYSVQQMVLEHLDIHEEITDPHNSPYPKVNSNV